MQYNDVELAFTALQEAGYLPRSAKLELLEGRIVFTITRPRKVVADRRTRSFKDWGGPIEARIRQMNICIQALRTGDRQQMVAKVTQRVGALATMAA